MINANKKPRDECLICSLLRLALFGAITGFLLGQVKAAFLGQASWLGPLKSFLAVALFCLLLLMIVWIKKWIDAQLIEKARSKLQSKATKQHSRLLTTPNKKMLSATPKRTAKFPAIPNCSGCGKPMKPGFNKGEYYWRCPDLPLCNRLRVKPYKQTYKNNFTEEVITTTADKAIFDQLQVMPAFGFPKEPITATIGRTNWVVNDDRNIFLVGTGGGAHEHPDDCFEMIFPDGKVYIQAYSTYQRLNLEKSDLAVPSSNELIKIYDIGWFGVSKNIRAQRQEIIDLFREAAQVGERSKLFVNHEPYINFTEVKMLKSHGIID